MEAGTVREGSVISVNTNLSALRSLSALENTTSRLNTATEALSTGLSINTPGDNPSGEAIVQTMTSQINGLNAAQQNAQNGLSVLQTAGGALDTVSNILQSLNTLAITAANSATESSSDVALIQSQVSQLTSELDRMASTVSFNGTELLGGAYSGEALQVSNNSQGGGASDPNQIIFSLSGVSSSALGLSGMTVGTAGGTAGSITSNGHLGFGAGPYTTATTLGTIENGGNEYGVFSVNGVDISWDSRGAETLGGLLASINSSGAGVTASFNQGTQAITLTNNTVGSSTAPPVVTTVSGNAFANDFKLSSPVTVDGTGGPDAITLIKSAISTVATETGQIGALMDRLNYTVSNLSTEVQNTAASLGTIEDVDMASEMSTFTQLQILQQSGTAMLAQANQAPSMVLKLMQ
jgi:flagellin